MEKCIYSRNDFSPCILKFCLLFFFPIPSFLPCPSFSPLSLYLSLIVPTPPLFPLSHSNQLMKTLLLSATVYIPNARSLRYTQE